MAWSQREPTSGARAGTVLMVVSVLGVLACVASLGPLLVLKRSAFVSANGLTTSEVRAKAELRAQQPGRPRGPRQASAPPADLFTWRSPLASDRERDAMQACPECGVMNDVTRATCRGCGATSAERGYEATLQPGWTPPVEVRPASSSRWLVMVLLVLIGAGVVWALRPARRFPTDVPLERYWVGEKRAAKDPCETRSTCVVVYMTPWCGACQFHVGSTLPKLRARWGADRDKPALKVVLGNGDSGRLEEMARRVGDPVFLDRDDMLLGALSVHRFPSFYVVDQANRITHEGDDAIAWLNAQP